MKTLMPLSVIAACCFGLLAPYLLVFAETNNTNTKQGETSDDKKLKADDGLVRKLGNVRVRILDISTGLTYRSFIAEEGPLDQYGEKPFRYLSITFYVEQLGDPDGANGSIRIWDESGDEIELKRVMWGVIDPPEFSSGITGSMAFMPEPADDAEDALVYRVVRMVDHSIPKTFSITATFFGQTVRFDKVRLP